MKIKLNIFFCFFVLSETLHLMEKFFASFIFNRFISEYLVNFRFICDGKKILMYFSLFSQLWIIFLVYRSANIIFWKQMFFLYKFYFYFICQNYNIKRFCKPKNLYKQVLCDFVLTLGSFQPNPTRVQNLWSQIFFKFLSFTCFCERNICWKFQLHSSIQSYFMAV